MVQAPRRTGFSGPTLVRLLARLTDVDVPESGQSLSDRLSLWLGWTDAIALAAVLDGKPPAMAPGGPTFDSEQDRESLKLRTTLADAIASDTEFTAARPAAAALADAGRAQGADRRRLLQLPPALPVAAAHDGERHRGLRSRLRGMLAGRNPEMTRLAMVDAIMERSLSVRERALMTTIPTLLGAHFERLRKAEQSAQEEAEAAEMPPPPSPAGHVSQGHAQRVAGRTGYSFSTGGRAARGASHPLMDTMSRYLINLVVFLWAWPRQAGSARAMSARTHWRSASRC